MFIGFNLIAQQDKDTFASASVTLCSIIEDYSLFFSNWLLGNGKTKEKYLSTMYKIGKNDLFMMYKHQSYDERNI